MDIERQKLKKISFLEREEDEEVEEDITLFYQTIDQNLNYKLSPEYFSESHYSWAHLSCASFIPECSYTSRSAVKIGRIKETQFDHTCIICHRKEGVCVKCSDETCKIWMHPECARRAGYYMDNAREISSEEEIDQMADESDAKRFKRLC